MQLWCSQRLPMVGPTLLYYTKRAHGRLWTWYFSYPTFQWHSSGNNKDMPSARKPPPYFRSSCRYSMKILLNREISNRSSKSSYNYNNSSNFSQVLLWAKWQRLSRKWRNCSLWIRALRTYLAWKIKVKTYYKQLQCRMLNRFCRVLY